MFLQSIWREEIGNRNRLVNLAGRNRQKSTRQFGGKKSAIEIVILHLLSAASIHPSYLLHDDNNFFYNQILVPALGFCDWSTVQGH
jgi:hypothetical protein